LGKDWVRGSLIKNEGSLFLTSTSTGQFPLEGGKRLRGEKPDTESTSEGEEFKSESGVIFWKKGDCRPLGEGVRFLRDSAFPEPIGEKKKNNLHQGGKSMRKGEFLRGKRRARGFQVGI